MHDNPTHDSGPRCRVRVAGRLDGRWTSWFDGLAIDAQPDGTTVIEGPIVDQAELHGLLQKVRDLGLPLLSVDVSDDPHP